MKTDNQSVAEIITSKFLEKITKEKLLPWQKSWLTIHARNIISGKPYRGINVLITSFFGKDSAFLTYNQAQEHGGHVSKGCKALPVVFYKPLDKRDKEGKPVLNSKGEPEKIPLLRYYNVFNLCDIEANDAPEDQKKLASLKEKAQKDIKQIDFIPDQMAERLIQSIKIPITHGGNRACYTPATDRINLPAKEAFSSIEAYYCTCFHEIGHSLAKHVGHELKDYSADIGARSSEELVAEIFANFCLSYCGLDSGKAFDNSAAYLNSWLSFLGNEPKQLISASGKAQKRFDLLLKNAFGAEDKEKKWNKLPNFLDSIAKKVYKY